MERWTWGEGGEEQRHGNTTTELSAIQEKFTFSRFGHEHIVHIRANGAAGWLDGGSNVNECHRVVAEAGFERIGGTGITSTLNGMYERVSGVEEGERDACICI